MGIPDIIRDLDAPPGDDAGGALSVQGAALRWAFDGPTLFLSELAGEPAAFERLFAVADIFARGRFAEALVVCMRRDDTRFEECRRLGFEEAAGLPLDGYVSLVREVA